MLPYVPRLISRFNIQHSLPFLQTSTPIKTKTPFLFLSLTIFPSSLSLSLSKMAAPPVVRFPIFTTVRAVGAAVTVLLLTWALHFRGGLALISDNKDLIFNVTLTHSSLSALNFCGSSSLFLINLSLYSNFFFLFFVWFVRNGYLFFYKFPDPFFFKFWFFFF